MMLQDKLYSVGKVAKFCAVSRITVLKWVEEERLKSFKLPSGHLRVTYECLIEFMTSYKMPLPEELKHSKRKVLLLSGDLELASFLSQIFSAFEDRDFSIELSTDIMEAVFLMGIEEPDLLVFDRRVKNIPQEDIVNALKRFSLYDKTKILVFDDVAQGEALAEVTHKPWPLEEIRERLRGLAS